MKNSETRNPATSGLVLTLMFALLLSTILRAIALDVTYTSTTTYTTSITHVTTQEVFETITRTQTSIWYSTFTDTFTMEGPAPYIQIVSQQWQRPTLILVLYNGGGPGTVRIALYDGSVYLGSTDVGAPQPGQTLTYTLRILQTTTGVVYASVVSTRGYPTAVTTMRVETYTGQTVVVETRFRTRYFVTSVEERMVVSTFVGTRPAGLSEDPIQLAVLALVLAGGAGLVGFAARLRHASRREKLLSAEVASKPISEASPAAKEVKEVPTPKIVLIAETKPPLDEQVYNYIIEHEGTISISQAAKTLAVTQDELKQAIDRLKNQGKIG